MTEVSSDIDESAKKFNRAQAAAKVRNEGLGQKDPEQVGGEEIDLEIEAPGSASKVAEEGSKTI